MFTSASIGIALNGPGYHLPEDLLRDADTAMYGAKAKGKARYDVFDSAMRARVVARLDLETELRRGLQRGELRVHYQPIVTMKNARPTGFEALVRWQHPHRGLLAPQDFIEIAEETGMIVSIGWWVLDEACRQMADWHARFPLAASLTISVNVSCKQFFQKDLVEQVERILHDSGLNPQRLKLEITESAIMSDMDSAAAMLNRLRSIGVKVGIDDFGTGHSSLGYLQHFAIDTLKIDRSFISQMENGSKEVEIIQAVVTLAHNLGFDVVAEGIETIQQRDSLNSLGCEFGQGFYFCRAVDGSDVEALLSSGAENSRSSDAVISTSSGA